MVGDYFSYQYRIVITEAAYLFYLFKEERNDYT